MAIPISSKAGGGDHPHLFQGGGGHPISSKVGVAIPISSKEGEVAMLYLILNVYYVLYYLILYIYTYGEIDIHMER